MEQHIKKVKVNSDLINNLYQIYTYTFVIAIGLLVATFFAIHYYIDDFRFKYALFFIFTLSVLLFLAIGVVYPTNKKIKVIVNNLTASEAKSQHMTSELTQLNKEVKDINFALEEGSILIKINEKGEIIYANDEYCKISKYKKEALIGKKLFERKEGRQESIIYDHIKNPEKRECVWRGEIFDHAKDDTPFWMDVTLIPIISDKGELYQYMAICYNSTQRKQAEIELQSINEAKLKDQKIIARAIISGQELERKRMSQEVHDGIGQMLTGLKFGIESISLKDEAQQERVENIKNQLQNVIKEIRRISSDLRPAVLSDFGVVPAIKDLVKTINTTSSIPVFYNDETTIDLRFHKAIEVGIYRVLQESLNNALKHSKAENIKVKLSNNNDYFSIKVKDDGIGFNLKEKLKDKLYKIGGNGLASMGQRAELMQGEFNIKSNPNEGTTVILKVPLETVSEYYGNDQNSIG